MGDGRKHELKVNGREFNMKDERIMSAFVI